MKPLRSKMTVSIIGAGRIGTAVGLALKLRGHAVDVVVAKHLTRAQRVARLLGGNTLGASALEVFDSKTRQSTRLANSPVLIIAIPDDEIAITAGKLAKLLKQKTSGQAAGAKPLRRVVLHTSGALSSTVLAPLKQVGCAIGSLHPLVSVSNPVAGADLFKGAFFSVEGNPLAKSVARMIVRDLGAEAFTVKESDKALYHAAAVMASPNFVALIDIALEMLGRVGLSRSRARQVLIPLVKSTLANLASHDTADALTGTFRRGDVATVRRHLAAIKASSSDDALEAYVLLGQRSLAMTARLDQSSSGRQAIALLLSTAKKC